MKSYKPRPHSIADRILVYIARHGGSAGFAELELVFDLTPHKVATFMALSLKAGLIHRVGPRGLSKYVIGPAPKTPDDMLFQHLIVSKWRPVSHSLLASRSIFDLAAA